MALFLAHLCSCDSLLFNIQCPDMKHWKDMQGWDVHCCCSCLLFLLFFFSLLLLDSRLPSDEMLQVFEALRLPPLFDALSHSCHRGNFHGSTFQTFLNQDLPASHDPNASSMLSLRQFPGSQVHATFDLRRRKKKQAELQVHQQMRVLPKRVASQYGFCPLCWTRFDERYQASVAVSSLQRPWSKPSGPQRIREKARALWHHKLLSCEPPRKPINLDPGFRASRCVEH